MCVCFTQYRGSWVLSGVYWIPGLYYLSLNPDLGRGTAFSLTKAGKHKVTPMNEHTDRSRT